jgi:tetratricopeptide (TPR) repeat protein
MSLIRNLLEEVHRRSLWQVLGAYAVISWGVLQVVDQLVQQQLLPGGAYRLALGLVVVGFPVVLLTATLQGKRDPGTIRKEGLANFFTWRNVLIGAGGAFAIWGVLSAVWLAAGRPGPDPPRPATGATATTIAVLPFSFQGSSEYAYLSTGMVNLLGTRLDGAGELRSVDSRSILGQFAREDAPNPDLTRAREIAALFGAGRFVLGDIVEVGGHLQINVGLYVASGESAPLSESAVDGSTEEVFDLVDEMAASLLSGMYGEAGDRGRRIAGVTTASLPAFKAYLDGEAAFRTGQFGAAVEAFQRSVSLDSLYALAFYRLSVAAEWDTQTELSQWAAERAADGADRLSDRDRRLLDAHLAWRRGAYGEAESRYRSFLGTYPEDTEAWFQLGEVLFHANPMLGRSFTESRFAFEKVVSFEPDHSASLLHLLRIAAREGKVHELDSLFASLSLILGSDRESEERAMFAYSTGDEDRHRDFLRWLDGRDDGSVVQSAWALSTFSLNLDGIQGVATFLTEPVRAPEVRVVGHRLRALAFMARGEWSQAHRELGSADALDPAQALEARILFSLAPYSPVDQNGLRGLRERLENLDLGQLPVRGNPSFFFSVHDNIHPHIREYLLGLLSLEVGEARRALNHASVLEAMEAPPEVGTMARDLARGIRAGVLRKQGRLQEALAELTRDPPEIFYHLTLASPFVSLVNERFLRAELLRELGREDEALAWYDNLIQLNTSELPWLPVTLMRRAEILRDRGDTVAEAAAYEQLLALWSGADAELRPWLQPAVDRVDLLEAGGR